MANKFQNPWEKNQWAQDGEEYKKSAVGGGTEWLPEDAAFFTGVNPNTGESVYGNGEKDSANDSIAQKLNSFASTFRNVLARMYRKSTYTGNKPEDISNNIPLKEVVEYGHHFIRAKDGSYREYQIDGEYPGTLVASSQVYTIIQLRPYSYINNNFVKRGESYEIEVHTHPTFDPLVNNYEGSRNLAPSGQDIAYFPKFKDYILFVEAESMQFALVVINEKKSRQRLGVNKSTRIVDEYTRFLNESSESPAEASINAVKKTIGQAKDNGIAFYVNEIKSKPDFILQN